MNNLGSATIEHLTGGAVNDYRATIEHLTGGAVNDYHLNGYEQSRFTKEAEHGS